ncbi:MAG: DNA phosphorothioation-associated putative methyltransferase [Rhodopirellula sp.]|nr:DNA phosphorothioation-associated putative methyltransferase [Rhodopirellula sp.]
MNANETEIARHKTAIRRASYSLPIKCLLRDGLVHTETSVFDYGCGHGQDIELLRGSGIRCDGWDPAFRPDGEKTVADVVNLGYVINVIEDARERATAVRSAWNLSSKLLVVAAQIEFAAPDKEQTRFADGVITSRGTFGLCVRTHNRNYVSKLVMWCWAERRPFRRSGHSPNAT